MPQVDLETLVSACAGVSCDNKIACETLATTTDNHNHKNVAHEIDHPPDAAPDFPPESFCLSKDAEFDWFDRNAFIERKDSTKGNSHSTNLNPTINPNSNSQRFSNLKSKPSIIGLPKPQKSCFVEARRHCRPGNARLFPKRSGSVSKSDSLIEPSSPKVSCMGRVRSKKDRNRRLKNRQRSGRSNETESAKREQKPERKQRNGGGFFASFRAIFRGNKTQKDSSLKGSMSRKNRKDSSRNSSLKLGSKTTVVKTSDIRDRLPIRERGESPVGGVEPVGLGGMKRFASGRKSETWIDGGVI